MKYKNIIDIFYSVVFFMISFLVRDRNNLWLFGAQGGYSYSDNSKYFFEWILKNKKKEKCFWVTKDRAIYKDLRIKLIPVLYFYDVKNIFIIASAKYIICTHSSTGNDVYKFIRSKKVLITLWHGIPLKKMGRAPVREYKKYLGIKNEPDLFLVTSQRDAVLFSDLYNININNFFIGTYPRVNDLIFKAEISNNILYAPTFRDRMLQEYYDQNVFPDVYDLEKLNSFLVEFNYNFLIKLHPYIKADFPDLVGFSNIRIIPAFEDVQSYLAKSILLITDYSSIYFDYLNLDRELVFFIPDYDWYYKENNRGFIYEYEDVTPGVKCTSWIDLIKVLHNFSHGSTGPEFSDKRKEILDVFYTERKSDNSDLFDRCKLY